jgi:hypothetical protein
MIFLDAEGVRGSNPLPPTTKRLINRRVGCSRGGGGLAGGDGGGSGFTPAGTGMTNGVTAGNNGNGRVTISYTTDPTCGAGAPLVVAPRFTG